MAEEYERVGLVKPEVFIYQLPPRVSNRAVRAADWNLANPDWRGRMRIIAKGEKCFIKLEDRISGELFATCPVDAFPGLAVESVSDSSRYFLLRLEDTSGKHAFVGLGFEDRGDAFDFNVALQDHFKWVKQSKQLAAEEASPAPHKDYSLKAGQKISVNLGKTALGSSEEPENKPKSAPLIGLTASGGLLPPPSSGTTRPVIQPQAFPTTSGTPSQQQQQKPQESPFGDDNWSDFTSFKADSGSSSNSKSSSGSGKWVQF